MTSCGQQSLNVLAVLFSLLFSAGKTSVGVVGGGGLGRAWSLPKDDWHKQNPPHLPARSEEPKGKGSPARQPGPAPPRSPLRLSGFCSLCPHTERERGLPTDLGSDPDSGRDGPAASAPFL
ncbi:hypothetical protein P7K49_002383 [Saguinus oedipus]|uniref:Uncharacterized protein n=1 Tax=Saguinus oedipus TaxID=9490 RepID=A0ABQ9WL46_SAGOE|nr:hypothetical protein P7K49_002383 [Saguinus oedipus]